MSALDIVLAAGPYIVGFWIGWYAHIRYARHPYRWHCPAEGCHFNVSGNEMATVNHYITTHQREHQ